MGKRSIGLAMVLVTGAIPASAAASDVRVGNRSDPADDASPAVSEYAGGGSARLLDVREVKVVFDADSGSLRLDYLGSLNGVGHAGLDLHAALSAPGSSGSCSTADTGGFRVEGRESARGYLSTTLDAKLYGPNGVVVATGTYLDEDQTGVGPRMSFTSPSLIGLDLRCVTSVSAVKALSGFLGSSVDVVAPFCLGACPRTRAPALTRSGTALTWDKVGSITSYVVATSTAPEGSPDRTTTYETVTGTSFTPPAAPGQTRYYGVRADVGDALWSTPEAIVSYTAPPSAPSAPVSPATIPVTSTSTTPAPAPPVTSASAPSLAPTPVTTTQDLESSPKLTPVTARAAAIKALAGRFATSYKRRSASGYKLTCSAAGAKASCQVQWRYRGSTYRATLRLVARAAGAGTSVSITRVVVRKG